MGYVSFREGIAPEKVTQNPKRKPERIFLSHRKIQGLWLLNLVGVALSLNRHAAGKAVPSPECLER